MLPDHAGFLQPVIDPETCTDCGVCRKICPAQPGEIPNLFHPVPDKIFAAWNKDDAIRANSSSGGVFTALAESVIAQGGVVVGAAFNEKLQVEHVIADNSEALKRFRGSKYVQSHLSKEVLREIRRMLREGRVVLFSGVPCQITGLHRFLRQAPDHLLSVDMVCHGVPSPMAFEAYIGTYSKGVKAFDFRKKIPGWVRFSVNATLKDGRHLYKQITHDPYMIAFLRNLGLREACYDCRYCCTERVGDVTLADFWGVKKSYPQYDLDDKGTSLIMVNSSKGASLLDKCHGLFLGSATLAAAVQGNHCLKAPCKRPPERDSFYDTLTAGGMDACINRYRLRGPNLLQRWIRSGRRTLSPLKKRLFP